MVRSTMLWVMAGLLLASAPVFGQTFPDKPIRMVIPFPPGGSIDTVGRTVAQKWATTLNQQIVIENRGGAGGTIGTELVAKARPDGYTISYGNAGPLSIGLHIYKKIGYDLFKDFAPVSQVTSSPFIIFASAAMPFSTTAELIAYAKANPGKLNFASSGVGSGLHLVGELFKSVAGVDIVHVPFKGMNEALPELFSGRVQLAVSTAAGLAEHVKSGRLKAIVSTGARRSPVLPDTPTCFEAGLPGFHATSWHVVVAPAGTPKPIVLKLQQTLAAALTDAELRNQMAVREDAEPVGSTPEATAEFLRAEYAKWGKVVKDAGVKEE